MYREQTSVPSTEILERLQVALGSAYVIERELGGGGMSRIFLAREVQLGRRVVVKLLPPEYASGVNGERFHHEILLAARLQHPHIVPILAAGEMNGVPYYTMPFIDGESLRFRLLRGDRITVGDVTRILHDVIDALAYAHEHNVVHRDIKPDNVLMSRQHAVITDFGVAKALCAAHDDGCGACAIDGETGMAVGTPAYMAPEQAAADPSTDHRADIYGFGVLAYELLTGHPPFSGREPLELLAAHVAETPISIEALRPEVPAALADLVMRCLEKRPEMRPATALEVREALEAIGSLSEVIPLAPRTWRFTDRVSRIAAAVALAVVGAGAAMLNPSGERGTRSAEMADAAEVQRVADGAKPRPTLLGPGLIESHWIGARKPAVVELPAVVATEPRRTPAKPVRPTAPRLAKASVGSAAGSGGTTADRDVRVTVKSRHGSATVTVGSLDGDRKTIETTARRLQMFEAMAGGAGAVLASMPILDSMTVERGGHGGSATIYVRDTPARQAPESQPRRQSPDAGSSAASPSPTAPAVPAAAAPAVTRVIGLAGSEEAVRQVRAASECVEQEARRLREEAARSKRAGATS